jgi:hypothetical protein
MYRKEHKLPVLLPRRMAICAWCKHSTKEDFFDSSKFLLCKLEISCVTGKPIMMCLQMNPRGLCESYTPSWITRLLKREHWATNGKAD